MRDALSRLALVVLLSGPARAGFVESAPLSPIISLAGSSPGFRAAVLSQIQLVDTLSVQPMPTLTPLLAAAPTAADPWAGHAASFVGALAAQPQVLAAHRRELSAAFGDSGLVLLEKASTRLAARRGGSPGLDAQLNGLTEGLDLGDAAAVSEFAARANSMFENSKPVSGQAPPVAAGTGPGRRPLVALTIGPTPGQLKTWKDEKTEVVVKTKFTSYSKIGRIVGISDQSIKLQDAKGRNAVYFLGGDPDAIVSVTPTPRLPAGTEVFADGLTPGQLKTWEVENTEVTVKTKFTSYSKVGRIVGISDQSIKLQDAQGRNAVYFLNGDPDAIVSVTSMPLQGERLPADAARPQRGFLLRALNAASNPLGGPGIVDAYDAWQAYSVEQAQYDAWKTKRSRAGRAPLPESEHNLVVRWLNLVSSRYHPQEIGIVDALDLWKAYGRPAAQPQAGRSASYQVYLPSGRLFDLIDQERAGSIWLKAPLGAAQPASGASPAPFSDPAALAAVQKRIQSFLDPKPAFQLQAPVANPGDFPNARVTPSGTMEVVWTAYEITGELWLQVGHVVPNDQPHWYDLGLK